jgi:hypothetical protein
MPPLLDERFWQDIRQGLTDAGNRGIVGGTLGAPVDLAAGVINAALMSGGYLGNKLGLLTADQMPQPIEHPVGGSEWLGQKMQDAGMVSENRNPVAETLMGLLGPSAISKGGQAAWAMEQNAAKPSLLNAATRDQLGAIVYHGSPHKFDRFDMSKVGTGEGAQAYGHGMYLAQEPQVARSYMKTEQPVLSGGAALNEMDPSHIAAAGVHMTGSRKAAIGELQWTLDRPQLFPDEMVPVYKKAIEHLRSDAPLPAVSGQSGNLYKVDLPDEHIARMLDWDKPLSQQPKDVQAVFKQLDRFQNKDVWSKSTFGEAYRELSGSLGGRPKASAMLRDLGYPGIKYFDGVSRAKGEGSYNYVVFDADLPKIIGHE